MRSIRTVARLLWLPLVLALALSAACSEADTGENSKSAWADDFDKAGGRLKVVTTVAPLSDIVRNIGGDRIALHGIIPDGSDSHTFEPRPSHAKLLGQADLILVNGLHLEEPTIKLAEGSKRKDVEIKRFGDSTVNERDWIFDFSFPREGGDPNPHLWMNPKYALRYAELAAQWLSETDPKNAAYYNDNLARYRSLIGRLDAGIRQAAATVPEKNRKLVTYHDSWAYWAREYGYTVIGAVQPEDFKEPKSRDVAAAINQIRAEGVPAVFGSEVFPSKVLEQIARESGATFVDKLSDDQPPGKPGDPNHTYVGMMLFNMRAMLPALGGNADALKDINPDRVYLQAR